MRSPLNRRGNLFIFAGRGGRNLYGFSSVQRAWGHARKIALSNGVIAPSTEREVKKWRKMALTGAALV